MSKIVGGLAISEWIARFVLALTRIGEGGAALGCQAAGAAGS